jgi:hypothetical protein
MQVGDLFKPLGGEYCNYFYYLSVISFVLFVMSFGSLLGRVVSKKYKFCMYDLFGLTQPLLMYFVSRLHYSICSSALM